MGISNFYQIIKSECPEQLISYHFSEISGFRIAVDISVFLYKYVRSAGEPSWMNIFLLLLCILKKHGIKAVCVFDGPNPPPEKRKEQEARRGDGQRQISRLKECIRLRNLLQDIYYDPDINLPDTIKDECKILICPRKGKTPDMTNYEDSADIVSSLNRVIERLEKQTLPITDKHKNQAISIVKMMGLACYEADGEAETICAHLAIKGEVDAVLTEDTDVLAYGCPLMFAFKDFSIGEERVYGLHHKSICDALEMNKEEFQDLCILLRCDYNRHNRDGLSETVRGYPPDGKKRKKPVGIGKVGALAMIKEYRRMEEVVKYIENPEPLIFRRCRELFSISKEVSNSTPPVPLNFPLDTKGLQDLIDKNNLTIGLKYIESFWKPIEICLDSDDSDEDFEEEY